MKRIRRGDHERIEAGRKQAADFGMDLGQTVALLERRAHRRGGISQGHEGEAFALFPEVERVLGLPHQTCPDQPDPQLLGAVSLHWNVPTPHWTQYRAFGTVKHAL